ncbi:MAG: CotH kinase family protein [Thiopseudomonas sp.]|nr:CotH kinase family protein [Thiopseudomonas sp.]
MTIFLSATLVQRLFFVLLSSLFILSTQTVWAEELATPEFSHESGFYPEEFDLVISHPDPEIKIYYTLDGSDPDPENLKGATFRYKNEYAQPPSTEPTGEFLTQEYKTFFYDKPILIKDRTSEPDRLSQISTTFDAKPSYFPKPYRELKNSFKNKTLIVINRFYAFINKHLNKIVQQYKKYILNNNKSKVGSQKYLGYFNLDYETLSKPKYLNKGMVVRAVTINKYSLISNVVTKVFFISNKSNLPVINISLPEKYLFDYDEGWLVAGVAYENWLKAGNFDSIENEPWGWPANWKTKNKTPAYLTILDPERNKLSESYAELRVHGNASRRFALKSLRIYPDKSKSKKGIELDIFKDDKQIGLDRINFRNGGSHGNSNYPTDAAIHAMMKDLNFATQRYQSMSIYINGEYYGILNARDRKDHYYISSLYELPNKKIDLLETKSLVKKGDSKSWGELLAFIDNSEDRSGYEFYNKISDFISIDSFIDYYVAELFIANADWPNNNIAYWRYKGAKKHPITTQGFTDGRWRWIMYDTDAAGDWADTPDLDMLSYATAVGSTGRNPDWSTFMLRKLLENTIIKELFIIRFSDLLNTYFVPDRTVNILRDVRESVIDEIPKHIERWSQRPKDLKTWDAHINKLTRFFEQRPKYQWQHLQNFFQLDERYTVQFNIGQQGTGKIKLNTLTLGDDPNQKYDVTDTPLFFPWSGQYFKSMPLTIEALPENGYAFSHWEVSGYQLTPEQKIQSKLILKPQDNLEIKAVMSEVAKP